MKLCVLECVKGVSLVFSLPPMPVTKLNARHLQVQAASLAQVEQLSSQISKILTKKILACDHKYLFNQLFQYPPDAT